MTQKPRSERVKAIIAEILKVVTPHDDWDIMEVWLAYRILALQFEKSLMNEIDEYVNQAYRKNLKR